MKPVSSARGDEVVRLDPTQGGVIPPHQGLETDQLAVGQGELRLVLEEEFGALQRAAERR